MKRKYLYTVIRNVLTTHERPMTITEIADEINTNGLYVQKKGTPTNAKQIALRAKNKPDLFDVTISLK